MACKKNGASFSKHSHRKSRSESKRGVHGREGAGSFSFRQGFRTNIESTFRRLRSKTRVLRRGSWRDAAGRINGKNTYQFGDIASSLIRVVFTRASHEVATTSAADIRRDTPPIICRDLMQKFNGYRADSLKAKFTAH